MAKKKGGGSSIKNRKVYEALKRKGLDKSSAAAISNAMWKRGKKGKGRKKGKK